MNIKEIYNDSSLYGHALTSFPDRVVSFARHSPTLCVKPEKVVELKNYWGIARTISYEYTTDDEIIHQESNVVEFFFTPFFRGLVSQIERLARHLIGLGTLICTYPTIVPIGFAVKMIHLGLSYLDEKIKISKTWNDAALFGHALTSAPAKAYNFTTAAPRWHLRNDGTRKGSIVTQRSPAGTVEHRPGIVEHLFYGIVPVSIIERASRCTIGIPATAVSAVVSPLGLATKGVHLALRACAQK